MQVRSARAWIWCWVHLLKRLIVFAWSLNVMLMQTSKLMPTRLEIASDSKLC